MVHDQAGRRWHGAHHVFGGFIFDRRWLCSVGGNPAQKPVQGNFTGLGYSGKHRRIGHPTLQANGNQTRGDPESLRESRFSIRSHKRTNPGRDRYSFELLLHNVAVPRAWDTVISRSNLKYWRKGEESNLRPALRPDSTFNKVKHRSVSQTHSPFR